MTRVQKSEKWIERMQKLLELTDNTFSNRRKFIEKHCPYGNKWFCNGRAYRNVKKSVDTDMPACEHFKNGRCELKSHTGKLKEKERYF